MQSRRTSDLLSAETAHLFDDRFRPFGRLGARYWIGDDRMAGSPALSDRRRES
jgi:hypothetical protein